MLPSFESECSSNWVPANQKDHYWVFLPSFFYWNQMEVIRVFDIPFTEFWIEMFTKITSLLGFLPSFSLHKAEPHFSVAVPSLQWLFDLSRSPFFFDYCLFFVGFLWKWRSSFVFFLLPFGLIASRSGRSLTFLTFLFVFLSFWLYFLSLFSIFFFLFKSTSKSITKSTSKLQK